MESLTKKVYGAPKYVLGAPLLGDIAGTKGDIVENNKGTYMYWNTKGLLDAPNYEVLDPPKDVLDAPKGVSEHL